MTTTKTLRIAAACAAALLAGAAQAHPGHSAEGLAAGLVHPLTGLDHLLAMIAVGLWSAAAMPAARRWLGPGVFVSMLLAGAMLAWAGGVLPHVETGVALSVAMLGAMLLAGRRVAPSVGLMMIAGAALLHGFAHGSEWGQGASIMAYAAGFMSSSALLHATGFAAAVGLRRIGPWAWRSCAALISCSGLLMLATRL